jgi:thiol:disulfide interchange protein DsbD
MHDNHSLRRLLLLLTGLTWLLTGVCRAEQELLLPSQAFQISGYAEGTDTVVAEWDIVPGYYLYRSKFKFLSETPGIELGTPQLPPGLTRHDEFFGDVEIYRDRARVQLPLKRAPGAPDTLTLQATSQGCADQGICYPPHAQTILVRLEKPAVALEPIPTEEPMESPPREGDEADASEALAALGELSQGFGVSSDDELLDPEDAYRLSVQVENGNEVRLYWQIADGTYLYKDKIELRLEDAEGVALGQIQLPPPEVKEDSIRPDGSFGDVEVYKHQIDLPVALIRTQSGPTEATLIVGYQGCAEIGVCYPPQQKRLALALPAAERVSTAAPAASPIQPPPTGPGADTPISEQDRIAATLAAGNIWIIAPVFFGFGLMLAFTPCVFPMIPILSGIIAGQGEQITPRKAFILSLVYVLAMATTYAVAGVLAGMFGQNLSAAFQNPWVLSIFAGVFVLLALSMFGFYDLQLPAGMQSRLAELSNRQEGGTLVGVAIMGVLSALIVGPCVAPPLAGAVIYIGQTADAALGGLALLALGLGMGAPLLVIGTSAGKLLPRAGGWMDAVKAVFGVLLLAVAIVLLERIVPAAVAMLLWGLLLIISAVYMGALKSLPVEASGWARLWKGLGVAVLVYGSLMLIGAAAGGKDTLQPLRGLGFAAGGAEPQHLEFRRIKTLSDLDREVAAANAQQRPVMLDFYADWCVTCKEMERYTFSDPRVVSALEGAVLLQADVTANDAEDQALLKDRFKLLGPPAILLFDTEGRELRDYRVVGFMEAGAFADHVRRILQ